MVFEPGNETELAAALRCADAAGLSVVPRGGGTKTSWGNPPSARRPDSFDGAA